MYYPNTRQLRAQKIKIQQRIIILLICLLITIAAIVLITHATVGTIQTVQQSQTQVNKGDVHLIRSWMTIPYIAHQQQVPRTLLYATAHLKDTPINRHLTLEEIAEQRKETIDALIGQIQNAILHYRKTHPFKPVRPGITPIITRGENVLY